MQVLKPQAGAQEMFLSSQADIVIYGAAPGGLHGRLLQAPGRNRNRPGELQAPALLRSTLAVLERSPRGVDERRARNQRPGRGIRMELVHPGNGKRQRRAAAPGMGDKDRRNKRAPIPQHHRTHERRRP